MNHLTTRTAVTVGRHPLWLDAFGQLLERIGITLVAQTTSPAKALDLMRDADPDILIVEVDATDGDVDGWQCLRVAQEQRPDVRVIASSDSADERAELG